MESKNESQATLLELKRKHERYEQIVSDMDKKVQLS